MEAVIAVRLRDAAREAMMQAGGRGFMRFATDDCALLATDAIRRCDDAQKTALTGALKAAGFACVQRDDLLLITPCDETIQHMTQGITGQEIDWTHPLHPAQALANRWMREPELPFTQAGRRLVLAALRLTGQPGAHVLSGLDALRAQAAIMLRTGDRSGMRAAAGILGDWCEKEERR